MAETKQNVFEALIEQLAAERAARLFVSMMDSPDYHTLDEIDAIEERAFQAERGELLERWMTRYFNAAPDSPNWVDGYAEGHDEGFRTGRLASTDSLTDAEVFALYRERRLAEEASLSELGRRLMTKAEFDFIFGMPEGDTRG